MNLSTSHYRKHTQPTTIASAYLRSDASPLVSAFLLSVATVAYTSDWSHTNFGSALLPKAYYSSLRDTAVESLGIRRWTQPQEYLPTDEDFADLATGLVQRQRNAPRMIDEILALHMAELYD
jgi:hypothetical protein